MASSSQVTDFNRVMQTNGVKDQWLRANGLDPSRALKLTDQQRRSFQQYLTSQGAVFPDGVEIDAAGNMNENEGFGKQLKKWGPLAAGAAVTLFGIPGTPIAGLLGGGGAAAGGVLPSSNLAGGAFNAAAGISGAGAGVGGAVASGLGATALKYGLEYGLPAAAGLVGAKMQSSAQRESDALMADYYTRALDAEKEERDYRRGFDEEERGYSRGVSEENQRYGRYSDSYGREDAEERLGYGRAGDTYWRLSDEERLAYDRSQTIRDKNYGYQQYGNFVETLEPYRMAGASANSRLSQLIGGGAIPDSGSYHNLAATARNSVQAVPTVPDRPTWDYSGTRPTWNYAGSGQTPAAAAAPSRGGLPPGVVGTFPVDLSAPGTQPVSSTNPVRMQAPDGEVRDVPADQVAIFEQHGAKRIA